MLIKDEKRLSKIDRMGRQWSARVLLLRCDCCMNEFERLGSNVERHAKRKHHFCSIECKDNANRSGGVIRDEIEKTCLRRFGTLSPLSSKEVQSKSKKTCLEKYGVHHTGAARELIEKRMQTCLKRYGSVTFLATEECQKILQSEQSRARRLASIRKIDWDERNRKRHETMKKNGSYGKSKLEDRFYEALCKVFGFDNIERQVLINKWSIDFYVKSINAYVQFDGVYWHGLDRPIETIVESLSPRDKIIYTKWLTDRKQNIWFNDNQLNFVRITDIEFKLDPSVVSSRLRRFT